MYYNVNCPHCGKPGTRKDDCLWPFMEGGPEYPAPSEPFECRDCSGWMRIIIIGDDFNAEKSEPPPWHRLELAVRAARKQAQHVGPMHAAWDDIFEAEFALKMPYSLDREQIERMSTELEKFTP